VIWGQKSQKIGLRSVYNRGYVKNFDQWTTCFEQKLKPGFKAMTRGCWWFRTVTPTRMAENGSFVNLTWILITSSLLYIQFIILHTDLGSQISELGQKSKLRAGHCWLRMDPHTWSTALGHQFTPNMFGFIRLQLCFAKPFFVYNLGPFLTFQTSNSKSPPFI